MKDHKKIEGLIQGIEAFISENRCSISNEELVLLKSCVSTLKESLKADDLSKVMNKISDVTSKILRVLKVASQFMDYLS